MMQRVLVTAGASGIGKEIARAFVAKGARVCVCDIDVTAMETAAKDIPGLITEVCDVSKRQSVRTRSPVFLFDPTRYVFVDVLTVAYAEDINDLPIDFENDAVISHPEFPIPYKILPQGKPILLRCHNQAGLNRSPDAFPHFHIDSGEIDLFDVGVILDRKRHATPRRPCA
jgi:hypothetical protein